MYSEACYVVALRHGLFVAILFSPVYYMKAYPNTFGFQDDGYIPKHSVLELQKAWPGSEVRWVTGGHVSSFILHNDEFRRAIVDGLDRLEWKESPL